MPAVTSAEVVERHRSAGRFFEAAGVRSFVLDEGQGEPVVCLHGVPSSCRRGSTGGTPGSRDIAGAAYPALSARQQKRPGG
jgi:hypothetical protein